MINKIPVEIKKFDLTTARVDKAVISRKDHAMMQDTTNNYPTDRPYLSLRRFFYLVFKRKHQILLFFSFVVATVAISTFLTVPVYQGDAQILVKNDRQNLHNDNTAHLKPVAVNRINSEIEILKSRSIAEKTLIALGPSFVYSKRNIQFPRWIQNVLLIVGNSVQSLKKNTEYYVDKIFSKRPASQESHGSPVDAKLVAILPKFRKALEAENIKNTNLIDVRFTHKDPDIAATVINKLSEVYLSHHLEIHNSSKTYDFFKEQAVLLKDKIEKSQNKLKALRKTHNIISLQKEKGFALSQEAGLRGDLNKSRKQQVEIERRIKKLRQQLSVTPMNISKEAFISPNHDLITILEDKLVVLELKEKEYLGKYTEQSRYVKNVRDEIRVVKAKLRQQETKRYEDRNFGKNPIYQKLQEEIFRYEVDLKAVRATEGSQQKQLDAYKERLGAFNEIEFEINQLNADLAMDRQSYKLYKTKFEESRISDEMDVRKMAAVSLIEEAKRPLKPINRKIKFNLLIAVILGLFGGVGLVICIEYIANRIEDVEDVEGCLQLPVLASIADFDEK